MPKNMLSDSEPQENHSDSSSEELETPKNGPTQKMTEYEKQRMKRIEENKDRMKAMGLHKMADLLVGSIQQNTKKKNKREKKGKRKEEEDDDDDDDEYRPEVEVGPSSSSEEEDSDQDYACSRPPIRKGKKQISTPKKRVAVQKPLSNSDFVVDDDDDALMQAIALSLQGSAGFLDVVDNGPSQSSGVRVAEDMSNERKGNDYMKEDTGKRKRKKSNSSRVQMTEDEVVLYFFQIDEAGKESITLRDLQRVAAAHDFAWTNKERADMINCFDSDGDGKLSLDDFRTIAGRCNMLKRSENTMTS